MANVNDEFGSRARWMLYSSGHLHPRDHALAPVGVCACPRVIPPVGVVAHHPIACRSRNEKAYKTKWRASWGCDRRSYEIRFGKSQFTFGAKYRNGRTIG